METIKKQFKNLIIGFGKGGKTLAAFLSGQNDSVAIIEQSAKMYGGSCINIACIPTKSLIQQAENGIDYQQAYGAKEQLVTALRQRNFETLNGLENTTVITGKASFHSANTVKVRLETGQEIQIEAERIFINTGSLPTIPSIEGMDSKKVFTSASIMEVAKKPEELLIIGGGFIGLEFADMFAKFGTKVTLLNKYEEFLPKEDDDISAEVFKVLTEKNIQILNNAEVEKMIDTNSGVIETHFMHNGQNKTIKANAVLVATGRKPNTEGLNLAAAGIQTNESGFVQVDEKLKTNVPHIWAIGDINGGPQFTYISLDDFRIIKNQITGGNQYTSVKERKSFPTCIFLSPPLSHAGLKEKEARAQGYEVNIFKIPAGSVPKAAILNEKRGVLKAVVDAKTNRILGCTLFCAQAHEVINTVQLAINEGLTFDTLRDTVYTHPSMTEALNELFIKN